MLAGLNDLGCRMNVGKTLFAQVLELDASVYALDSTTIGLCLSLFKWAPFRSTKAAIKFHIMRHLGDALDKVRKSEYARLSGKDRRYIKGQKYTLLSNRENLSVDGRVALKHLLAANKRLNTAYLLKESFGQLWDYQREGWARRFYSACAPTNLM